MIIQIALGIVLAFVLLALLPEILMLAIGLAALAVVAGVVVLLCLYPGLMLYPLIIAGIMLVMIISEKLARK